MAVGDIQTSFAAGELSPQLYARVDLDKFKVGAALLRNFFVDYRGGASNRAGTEYVDTTVTGARLIPFVVSTSAAYVLVFSNLLIKIYNAGVFVTSVATPYLTADLFEIAYTQSADVLTLVHPNYPPADLSRTSDVSFSYDLIVTGPGISPPVVTTMVAPHSGPYSFGYLVTAIDLDGREESLPSNPGVKHSEGMNETTNRVIGLTWTPPAQGVSRYNIYKWGPIDAVTMNPATVWGFIGSSQTTTFSDNNIAPDFSKQPPGWGDPFSGGQFETISVNNGGSGYDGVSGDWPTAVPYVPLTITGDGTGAAGYAVIDHATAKIVGVYLTNPGKNYTAATVTANGQGGTGATFNFSFTNIGALNPAATAYLQQRRVFGGSSLKPETLVMSQPGLITNFNNTPVTLATDSIVMSIAAEEVNTIKSFVQVNYGLLAFTTGGSFLINGGTPGAAIDANSPSVQPQVSQGANSLRPLRINYDVIYGQAKGNRIHNLAFAWQKQSYAGSDISTLAAHLFDTHLTLDWAYAEEPFKIVWAVRNDGKLLSLTYVPDQEVYAWCRHDTQGLFHSVCTVPENNVDAVYFIVERYIPANNPDPSNKAGNWFTYLERMAERQGCCIFDAWFLDCALSLAKPAPKSTLFLSGDTGAGITLTSTADASGARTPNFAGIRALDTSAGTNIAQGVSGVDWTGRRFWAYATASSQLFSFNLDTYAIITGPTSAVTMQTGLTWGEDNHLYCVPTVTNQVPLVKANPTTFATLATFGVSGGGFFTDATHWAYPADYDVCFDGFGTPFMISVGLDFNGHEVAQINLSTMAWIGFNYAIDEFSDKAVVTKGVNGHAHIVARGGHFAQAAVNFGVYTVNVGLVGSMTKKALTPASAIAGWTHITMAYGVFFDKTDGNLIAHMSQGPLSAYNAGSAYILNDTVSFGGHDYINIQPGTGHQPNTSPTFWFDLGVSGASEYRVIKINALTGAVMWTVLINNAYTGVGRMSDTDVSKGLYIVLEAGAPHRLHQINTLTGADTTSTVAANVLSANQIFSDTIGQLLTICQYAAAPPAVISGQATWTSQWATFGPAPTSGAFSVPGQVVQIGCGKILLTAVATSFSATGTVIDPLDIEIPSDPNHTPLYIAPGDWTLTTPVSALGGLGHLEGKQIAALADGIVYQSLTVVSGSITLPVPATNIVVGLEYGQQIQTLYLTTDGIQEGSDQGKRKQISGITLRTDCTKGLSAGTDFAYMTPIPELNEELLGHDLYTGDARVLSFPQWDRPGQTCIQQTLPLPATVLGVVVEVTPGDTGS